MAKDIHDKYVDPPYTTDQVISVSALSRVFTQRKIYRRTALVDAAKKYKNRNYRTNYRCHSKQPAMHTSAIQKEREKYGSGSWGA